MFLIGDEDGYGSGWGGAIHVRRPQGHLPRDIYLGLDAQRSGERSDRRTQHFLMPIENPIRVDALGHYRELLKLHDLLEMPELLELRSRVQEKPYNWRKQPRISWRLCGPNNNK